jgi:hypothetical protein
MLAEKYQFLLHFLALSTGLKPACFTVADNDSTTITKARNVLS